MECSDIRVRADAALESIITSPTPRDAHEILLLLFANNIADRIYARLLEEAVSEADVIRIVSEELERVVEKACDGS